MSTEKIKVAVLYGGRSSEHNISILSAWNVVHAMDRSRFEPVLIGIDKTGVWHYNEGKMQVDHLDDPNKVTIDQLNNPVILSQNADDHILISLHTKEVVVSIDVIFPVLHGTYGEDGSVQGLAKLANLPCVGCGILGSAAGMDKDVTKRLLRDSGIHIANFMTLRKGYNDRIAYSEIVKKLGTELFIKPANLGSSVGVSFVKNEAEYNKAIIEAFYYDPKVIVEEKLTGREIECAVMGNIYPEASAIGEVIPKSAWYSFENKYIDTDGAKCRIPADLDTETTERIKEVAVDTYRMMECEGMARVDVFLLTDGKIVVNEINTIPGFTKISMYPKLWEESGLPYTQLISRLIELSIESQKARNALKQ